MKKTIQLNYNEVNHLKEAINSAIADKEVEKQEYLNRKELSPLGKDCLGIAVRKQNELMQILKSL